MRFLILFLCIFLTACTKEPTLFNTQSYVFGTLVDISIFGETEAESQRISGDINRQFQLLHNRLHAWRPSEITAINYAFGRGTIPITVKPDVAAMIAEATELSKQSGGTFNPAIGGLLNAWGFERDEFNAVDMKKEVIDAWLEAKPQMSDIVIENNKIHSNNPNVKLDFGGYAKGYALDIALKTLHQNGVKNALVNIGGNIIALGQHGANPWRVGIQHPRQPNAIATLDLPSGWAIGTSGDYQRYFELKGKRYCHIINPTTGMPTQNVQSVTVLIPPQANAGVLSDVASKPIFIAPPQQRLAAAKQMQIKNFLVIESEQSIQVSQEMAHKLTWVDKNAEKQAKILSP
jgi:FAD:protein FMN transferase